MRNRIGRPLLVHDGFTFHSNRRRGLRNVWICSQYRKNNCKARITTNYEGVFQSGKFDHNHQVTNINNKRFSNARS